MRDYEIECNYERNGVDDTIDKIGSQILVYRAIRMPSTVEVVIMGVQHPDRKQDKRGDDNRRQYACTPVHPQAHLEHSLFLIQIGIHGAQITPPESVLTLSPAQPSTLISC
jgi:hypothetical protein